jgi:peptidoglycan hydrolase CwlO-like protein
MSWISLYLTLCIISVLCIQNTLTENGLKSRKKSVEGKLEKVEAKMKSIQASLSTMAGPEASNNRDIYQLKKELESQESFITQ